MKFIIPMLLVIVLLAAIVTTPLTRAIPSGYVIYRIDDIQSNWLPHVQILLLDKFIKYNTKASLAVIPYETSNQGIVFNKIRQGVSDGLFEIAAHGWKHVDYSALDIATQYSTIHQSKYKLQQTFGVTTKVFIPPYDAFNKFTLQVLAMHGFNVISATTETMNKTKITEMHDKMATVGIYRIPETISYMEFHKDKWIKTPVDTIISSVEQDSKKYGFAVVTIHPQNFAMMKKGVFVDKINKKELASLDSLMHILKNANYESVSFEDIVKMSMEKQVGRRDVLMGRTS